jgi:hypothetical protein
LAKPACFLQISERQDAAASPTALCRGEPRHDALRKNARLLVQSAFH